MFQDVLSVFRLLLTDLDTDVARKVNNLIHNEDWDAIAKLKVSPQHYTNPDLFHRDCIAVDFLRKADWLPTSFNRKGEALASFIAAEKQCYRTNKRILSAVKTSSPDDFQQLLLGFLDGVKKRVGRVLGRLPDDLEFGRFGPGATFEDKGRHTTVIHKMQSRPTVTSSARCLLDIWSGTAWCRSLSKEFPNRSDPKTIRGNRFTSVPKTSVTDRGIAVEPSINVFYQLAVGRLLRQRLNVRAKIDLELGQSKHRLLAQAASQGARELATIDLSNASDTVSYQLVKAVLPDDWFQLLESLRSPFTMVGDRHVHLQKFSSMGNGFTFELETLVFWAIAQESVGGSDEISVYGDDIIVPTAGAEDTLYWLQELGFTPNGDKTFISGPFRESCGGDYFLGVPVRAHFLKENPSTPSEWISLYNGLMRLNQPYLTRRARGRILDMLPVNVRMLKGPKELGDLVIHTDDVTKWQTRRKNSIRYVRGLRPVLRRTRLSGLPPLTLNALALYGVPARGFFARGSTIGHKECWVFFS